LTVAAFMDLALYHPDLGYYARAEQRSGRAGDFFTSVDVGPLFGELLAIQIAEMARLLHESPAHGPSSHESQHPESRIPNPESRHRTTWDLVEAGAGNGRLSADILRALRDRAPSQYGSVRLHLVEASAAARAAQPDVLGDVRDRLVSSGVGVPDGFEGVLIANELLDAMPVHQVVMRERGLREVFVAAGPETPALHLQEGAPSTPALQAYLDRAGVRLEPGFRAEINLRAVDWVREAAQRLRRGFLILMDYGHEARELYSVTHAQGTLTTFLGHRSAGPEQHAGPAWLANPGERDITAHVDFTSVRTAAEAEGLTTLALMDQTYVLLGLLNEWSAKASAERTATAPVQRALKTLIMPGGLGSAMKVLILGKHMGRPQLRGCSFGGRLT
jgi:SAM-dependent MidA family methyltransferase